jgi:tetratricopeptide (TPR) repeat protein
MRPGSRLLGWLYAFVCAAFVVRARVVAMSNGSSVYAAPTTSEVEWFRQIKPYCNSVEVQTVAKRMSPPSTVAGAGYHAACFALAGRIDDARRIIDNLGAADRYKAAGIVFDVGHPVADAGDDRSAGPIMELVIDYWPNHYMALYHAGMAEYMLGQRDLSKRNLQEFLKYYHEHDAWTNNAVEILKRLDDPAAAPMKRPMEPPG